MLLDIEKTIREYLPTVVHMSLGTSKDNKPWVCEVHYAYDRNLNLYFLSMPFTRHCQEIASNPNVSGNIVQQLTGKMKPRGVYFEGKCTLVENPDKDHIAFKTYHERFKTPETVLEVSNDNPKFYKVEVTNFYVFDARESDPPHKYSLEWPVNYSC